MRCLSNVLTSGNAQRCRQEKAGTQCWVPPARAEHNAWNLPLKYVSLWGFLLPQEEDCIFFLFYPSFTAFWFFFLFYFFSFLWAAKIIKVSCRRAWSDLDEISFSKQLLESLLSKELCRKGTYAQKRGFFP